MSSKVSNKTKNDKDDKKDKNTEKKNVVANESKKNNSKNNNENTKNKEKEKKPDKLAHIVCKDDEPNKATALGGLKLNVKTVQKWLKEYYTRYPIEKKKKEVKEKENNKSDKDDSDKNNNEEKKEKKVKKVKDPNDPQYVNILNAQYAISAADHVLCILLVNLASEKSKKLTAGMYTITEENMVNSVKMDKDLNYTFGKFLDNYDTLETYAPQLKGFDGVGKKTVIHYITSHAFSGGNTNFHLEEGAYNFLMFILLKNRILLAEAAFYMTRYNSRSSVSDKAVICSTNIVYIGNLKKTIMKKMETVSASIRGIKTSDMDDNSRKGSKDSKDSKESKDGKKPQKKSTKDNKKDTESESESVSESASESGSESGSNKSGSESDSESS